MERVLWHFTPDYLDLGQLWTVFGVRTIPISYHAVVKLDGVLFHHDGVMMIHENLSKSPLMTTPLAGMGDESHARSCKSYLCGHRL